MPKKPRTRVWTLYVIEAQNGFLYTGITKDLERRFAEHGEGKRSAKFFRRSPPKRILFSTSGLTQSMALRLEYAVKQLDREAKLALARGGDPRAFKQLLSKPKGLRP